MGFDDCRQKLADELETYGRPESHRARVTVDPADPQLFRFKAEVVPGDTVNGER